MTTQHRLISSIIIKISLFTVAALALWVAWITQVHDRSVFKTEIPAISSKISQAFHAPMQTRNITRIVASHSKYFGNRIRIYKGKFFWDHELKYPLGNNKSFVIVVSNKDLKYYPADNSLPKNNKGYKKYKSTVWGIIETVIESEIDYTVNHYLSTNSK